MRVFRTDGEDEKSELITIYEVNIWNSVVFIIVTLSKVGSLRDVKVGLMRAAGRKGKAIRFLKNF